ncbi:hypothetical protein ACS0TY_030441 [Phlomoides rotata]
MTHYVLTNIGVKTLRMKSMSNMLIRKVGTKILLKGMVAKGFVESLNPTKLVGNGEILGPEWCEVKVIVAIEYNEPLIRKIGGVKVVGQAIGRSIAWPKHLVQVEDGGRAAK